ncbi:ABC transporter permease, partial [Acidovorax sp. NPDC077664]
MTAKPSLLPSVGRFLVYAVLALATAFFLLPLYAMLVTSFKDAEEIRSAGHWLGTDVLGRSGLARLAHAAQLSLGMA